MDEPTSRSSEIRGTAKSAGPIFMSYARKDIDHFYNITNCSERVKSLIWYDLQDIKKSERNWRSKLDSVIKDCSAMLVLCSPESRQSDPVNSEIEIAKSYEKPIFPLWIAGREWALSAPFSLLSYNYTDVRDWTETSKQEIEVVVNEIVERWPRYFRIDDFRDDPQARPKLFDEFLCLVRDDKKALCFVIERYTTYAHFLQDVYTNFLDQVIEPFTYGSRWILGTHNCFLLPASWAWDPWKASDPVRLFEQVTPAGWTFFRMRSTYLPVR